ncbi:MAG TPA: M23 family metallopeptidase [Chthoniobacterales bacterium]|nr:M23 family metallopeptidase [Chthoniobacterales bacterium]
MSRRFVFALLLFFARPLFAEDSIRDVEFVKEQNGDAITLIAKSKYVSEFTVTLEATLENMTPSRPVPFTVESAGRSSFVLVRFERNDKTKRFRYDYRPYCQFGARRSTTSNDADYAMPFGPGRYVVMQGPRGTFSHFAGSGSENAVDWTVPEGTIVCAARDGRVVGVKQDSNIGGADRSFRPFANYVIVKHADGTFAEYVHLQKDGAMVKLGDEVTTGQPIGLSGQTGFASKPHLHFDVFQAIDGKRKQSLPFRLKTNHGTFTDFVRGQAY